MKRIKKVLVANRGEIAVRIIRTCKDLGIQTVAVFSETDRKSLHVRMADEAVSLNGVKSSETYLVIDKIIAAAKLTGADAIHPGYGFLSENALFAEAVEAAGIIFIGPSADSIRKMGDKTTARKLLKGSKVPLAPGTEDSIEDLTEAKRLAAEIGYPVLIKASAGGGGKGMRIVHDPADFEKSMHASQNEARNAFGDSRVYIEKYLENPRHIEFQILADQHGNTVHLFERECSIQRRHQKVIEEAPSSVLTPEMRQKMGEAAIEVAKIGTYYGAGTVEFLVDKHRNFYFLEMNTRLQVEHPVTELITGLDLVREQIRIAEGETLGFEQKDLKINGHAVECRVYAEDPMNNFLPDTGMVHLHRVPTGPGVRVDSGIVDGMEVSVHFDPMISKLVTWDRDRNGAIARMCRALEEYTLSGVQTTLPFCQFVMKHPVFQSGNFDTHFIQNYFKPEHIEIDDPETIQNLAIGGLNAIHWFIREEKSEPSLSGNGAEKQGSLNLWKVRRK
ncbi:MAG: acetyl-CoA carboxylase biotin carboxylase subunit [Bacteroidetes bacterium]|nr:acetyl-CoA carboxylase biotin carboxylase subunit [Bacteroidota bacterium]